MNTRCLALLPIASFLALAGPSVAAEPTTPPPPPVMIADLTQSAPDLFLYGTWEKALAIAPTAGMRVQGSKGAQGDGGIGRNLAPEIDLSRATFVEVALAVQPGNEVPEFTIALNDADGTQSAARMRVEQIMPGQPIWFRLKLSDFVAVKGQEGKDPKMEWNRIAQWHLQGDWATKKPAQVLFIALRGRP